MMMTVSKLDMRKGRTARPFTRFLDFRMRDILPLEDFVDSMMKRGVVVECEGTGSSAYDDCGLHLSSTSLAAFLSVCFIFTTGTACSR